MRYTVDRREMRRYMGVRNVTTDGALERLIDEAICEIEMLAAPRHVCREIVFSCQSDTVVFPNQIVHSQALCDHLADCSHVFAFAATLGAEVDRKITKDSVLHPALAIAEQAAATALLESYCDACCNELEIPYLSLGMHFKPRFSPGYADCSLESQKALLDCLDAYKRIGLALTDSNMMTPIKSISAWIGVTDRDDRCTAHGCALCDKIQCQFRKEEIADGNMDKTDRR